jgi:hypothetical protein
LTDSAGNQQDVQLEGFTSNLRPEPDTVYIPACTVRLTPALNNVSYGSFTVADDGFGSLVVTGTTGATVAAGNTIDFDLTKLAAVAIHGTDLTTAAGWQQSVQVQGFVGRILDDTLHIPACTVQLPNDLGAVYGTFTVADDGAGCLAVTGTTAAAVATGNTIHFDLTKLAAVTIFGKDLETAAGRTEYLQANGFVGLEPGHDQDTAYFPAGPVQLVDPNMLFGQLILGTFTVSDVGSGVLAITATTGEAIATDPHTITFALPTASLSGIAFEDFNNDGQVDFGERGIAGVTIALTGSDDFGHAVNQSQRTEGDGAYVFFNLLPGGRPASASGTTRTARRSSGP